MRDLFWSAVCVTVVMALAISPASAQIVDSTYHLNSLLQTKGNVVTPIIRQVVNRWRCEYEWWDSPKSDIGGGGTAVYYSESDDSGRNHGPRTRSKGCVPEFKEVTESVSGPAIVTRSFVQDIRDLRFLADRKITLPERIRVESDMTPSFPPAGIRAEPLCCA